MADLPILPERFDLVVRDERSKKQMGVVTKLLRRKDVERVINAADAGREGELIFAYIFEKAGADKPVQRLWLSSMTNEAMREAFAHLRPGEELKKLEEAARSRSEADWIVGHERDARGDDPAALVVRRRGVARSRPDADAGDPRPPRGGDPRLQARAVLARRRHVRRRRRARLRGALPRRRESAGGDGG